MPREIITYSVIPPNRWQSVSFPSLGPESCFHKGGSYGLCISAIDPSELKRKIDSCARRRFQHAVGMETESN